MTSDSSVKYPGPEKDEGADKPHAVSQPNGGLPIIPATQRPFAFAFDIDGVLLHSKKQIPGARDALSYLALNNVPYILLTNGGGKTEADRVAELQKLLKTHDITTDMFVQSHTPFQYLLETPENKLKEKTVLVTGSDAAKAREIAHLYGFKNVVIPADILTACPNVWPFEPLMEQVYKQSAKPLPKPVYKPGMNRKGCLKIDAVLVFNDPRDWALDVQLILDVITSDAGYLGTKVDPSKKDFADSPTVYYSNPDMVWATGYHLPRLGQGAFQSALHAVWKDVGAPEGTLKYKKFGKPEEVTYHFAAQRLDAWRSQVTEKVPVEGEEESQETQKEEPQALQRVYMVGDGPWDVKGANQYSRSELNKPDASQGRTEPVDWVSMLVRTGVSDPPKRPKGEMGLPKVEELDENDMGKPRVVVDDVFQAVQVAVEREMDLAGWPKAGDMDPSLYQNTNEYDKKLTHVMTKQAKYDAKKQRIKEMKLEEYAKWKEARKVELGGGKEAMIERDAKKKVRQKEFKERKKERQRLEKIKAEGRND